MRNKGSIVEMVISLILFFMITLDFAVFFNFNFNMIKKIKFKYEEEILEHNLINILKRDLYIDNKIKNYVLIKNKDEYFIKTDKITYYLGNFKYCKLKKLKINESKVILDTLEIGTVRYIELIYGEKKNKILLE
ncbi:hypothetical protein [Fusobacterium sp. MFO224]|uniref:hypothetical protein n=1 Tax=Fusobacterium sp. MFO224 TaxID=3378070 RepID=UPI0038520CA1